MGNSLELKRGLRKTWYPFFGRFGSRLTKVQKIAIPEVLSAKNVVLCAATASGKTEAILAPLVQKLLDDEPAGMLQMLYVTPTRALANDLLERIEGPLGQVGWATGMWTSDKKVNLSKPPQVLITTPEGFDSLLSRHTEDLTSLKAIVLDELHMIDGEYRGDQLRILLERLRLVLGKTIWTCILSATIADPDQVASRYVDDYQIVSIQGQRPIKWQVFPSKGKTIPDEAISKLRSAGSRKILFFCNRRNDVETVASEIDKGFLKDRVLVHHGLIGREERLSVESAFKKWPVAACVATSTLEVGIDIGDVDTVVLYGPPPSVASLLQRIGRGNRRTGEIFALGISRDPEETEQFLILFNLAKSETLQPDTYYPKLGVAVQQIFSYVLQRRFIGTRAKNISQILRPFQLNEEHIREILESLRSHEWIDFDDFGRIIPSAKLEKEFRYGRMHSNISDRGTWTVVNEAGTMIGSVTEISPVFLIGGKARKVVRMDHSKRKVYVRTVRTRKADLVLSGGAASDQGKYFYLLPKKLQERSKTHIQTASRKTEEDDSRRPSTVKNEAWLWARSPHPEPEINQKPLQNYKSSGLIYPRNLESDDLIRPQTPSDERIRELDVSAIDRRQLTGKWIVFVDPDMVDETWNRIEVATEAGLLGKAAKVSTADQDRGQHVICVYTYNYLDRKDVRRVLEELRSIGFASPMKYKPDYYTSQGIYADTERDGASRYQA